MNHDVCEHFNPVDLPCAKCEEKRKSEALFLADELEIPLGTVIQSEVCRRAAKELRRLHAELERCKQVCAATSEAWREEAALAEPVQDGCDHCNSPLYAAIKCRVCGRETPIIEPEIKGDNKPDVADDLALIVRNAIAYINRLERQINELKRAAPPQRKPEPVGLPVPWPACSESQCHNKSECDAAQSCLYDIPPQRLPLTEEEIKKLLIEHAGMTVAFSEVDLRFARAIEAKHGIGVDE